MREIVLDTETTGLDPSSGHRIVEVGGVELENRVPTGKNFHVYINPQRDMPEEAFRVHGLSTDFLRSKPVFSEIIDDLLAFISDSPLVIHNAEFDIRFLNAELTHLGRAKFTADRAIDTLALARAKHPGSSNSLDALCQRYRIDSSRRIKHGALLDAEILAEVYVELTGGRQTALILSEFVAFSAPLIANERTISSYRAREFESRLIVAELADHSVFRETLGPSALWNIFVSDQLDNASQAVVVAD